MENENYIPENLDKPPLKVKHSELKREGNSLYKSECPACEGGVLLMQRNPETMELLNTDRCIRCGQQIIYEEMPNLV